MPPASGAPIGAECSSKSEEERDLRKFNTPGMVIIRNNTADEARELDLVKKLTDLGFQTSCIKDKSTVRELREDLYKERDNIQQQSSYFGSIVVVVISHQDAGGRLQVNDETYSINEITTPFLCREYAEIPTIFLFYICGTASEDASGITASLPCPAIKAPNCIVCVSPYEGYFEKLCEVLPQWEGQDLDLTSFLCKNNGDVSSLPSSEHLPLPILISSQQKRIILRTRGRKESNAPHVIECYDISKSERPGLALIFNCSEFQKSTFSYRSGSHFNVSQLSDAFHALEFTVNLYNDLTKEEFLAFIKNFGQSDLSAYGCLVVSVMTHSDSNVLFFSDGIPCKVCHVWEHFQQNPTLLGKPKLFFIEAIASNLEQDVTQTKVLQDSLIAFACVENEYPVRLPHIGSFFSTHLSRVLEHWQESESTILSALIELNRSVEEEICQLQSEERGLKQTPWFISFLTKDIEYSALPGRDDENAGRSTPPITKVDSDCIVPVEDVDEEKQKLLQLRSRRRKEIVERKKSFSRRKPAAHMFGLLEKAEDIVEKHFKEAIIKDDKDTFLQLLDKHFKSNKGNVKFLARHLLDLILENDRGDILEILLKYNLPQYEVLHFVYEIISEPTWKTQLLEITVNHYNHVNILRYHFNFCHNREAISGYPIMCVLKNELSESDSPKLIQKIDTLIRLGANVNDRYEQEDENTPVQFAAECGNVDIVLHLIKNAADIDIKIKETTARNIIRQNNSMKELNLIQKTEKGAAKVNLKTNLFKYLYENNEKEFLSLFASSKNDIDVNCHDGKYTLLQLAIKNNLKDVAQELLNHGANRSTMAGYSKEPVLIALEDETFESLDLFAQDTSKLDLRFCSDNSTFLHHLALNCGKESVRSLGKSKREVLENLLKSAIRQCIHLSAIDVSGKTALLLCAETENILLNILLDNGGFLIIDETIAEKLQPESLAKYLASKIQYKHDSIDLDFQFMKPIINCDSECSDKIAPEMDPIYEICNFEKFNDILANSPIVTFFLMRKWKQFAFVYILNFLIRLLFIVNFSSLVYLKLNQPEMEAAIDVCHLVNFILWIMLVTREMVQFWVISWQHYIRNFENYVEITQIIFVLLSQIIMLTTPIEEFQNVRWVISIAITLTYIDLTLLAGKHPSTEIYIRMFKKVSYKTLKLLLVFSSFILAFAFGFYILFLTEHSYVGSNNNGNTETEENSEDKINFSNPGYSILKTSAMLLGEFDVGNFRFLLSPYSSEMLFIIFLILVPIVLMNVLNALAISDTKLIIDEANVRCCISKIKLYSQSENVLLRTSKINPKERCYGFEIQKIKESNNLIGKLVNCIAGFFQALNSPICSNDYKITIELPKKRNVTIEMFTKFYERCILQVNEVSTAYEFAKANVGKNKRLFNKVSSKINKSTESTLDACNEIKNIRAELEATRKEFNQKFNDTKKDLNNLHKELANINKSLQILVERT